MPPGKSLLFVMLLCLHLRSLGSGGIDGASFVSATKRKKEMNRLYSYSHGCTGNEHETEADAGKSFQMQIISPA